MSHIYSTSEGQELLDTVKNLINDYTYMQPRHVCQDMHQTAALSAIQAYRRYMVSREHTASRATYTAAAVRQDVRKFLSLEKSHQGVEYVDDVQAGPNSDAVLHLVLREWAAKLTWCQVQSISRRLEGEISTSKDRHCIARAWDLYEKCNNNGQCYVQD